MTLQNFHREKERKSSLELQRQVELQWSWLKIDGKPATRDHFSSAAYPSYSRIRFKIERKPATLGVHLHFSPVSGKAAEEKVISLEIQSSRLKIEMKPAARAEVAWLYDGYREGKEASAEAAFGLYPQRKLSALTSFFSAESYLPCQRQVSF